MKNSRIYEIVNAERTEQGVTTTDLNERIGKAPTAPNVQRSLKSGSIKTDLLISILDALDLKMVIRNPKTGNESIVNEKTK